MKQRIQALVGVVLTLILGNLALAWFLLHVLSQDATDRLARLRTAQESEMVAEMRGRVDIACDLIHYIMNTSPTVEAAQQAAIEACARIRFGDGNYLWVHRLDPGEPRRAWMLVHPLKDLEGHEVTGLIDLERVSKLYLNGEIVDRSDPRVAAVKPLDIFAEFNRVCLSHREGVVGYYWPKATGGRATDVGYRKLAFVKLVPEWNWVVGAGAYADAIDEATNARAADLHNEHLKLVHMAQIALLLFSAVTVAVVSFFVWRLMRWQITELKAEVEERKRTEAELRQSEQNYREIFDATDVAVFIHDRSGKVLDANNCACEMLGYSRAELLSFDLDKMGMGAPPYTGKDAREWFRRTIEEGPQRLEWRARRRDGSIIDEEVALRASRIVGTECILAAVHNITARKRAEEQVALDAQRSAALLALNRMDRSSLQEITDFALEEAVRLTKSSIGYLAFVSEDMTEMTMHSWSRVAMKECAIIDKPIHYYVAETGLWGEAIRQRRPIITNDYTAENPWKKGTPDGHVALIRHMNVPVFAGGRIVLLAGVGNKESDYDDTDLTQLTLIMEGMWGILERIRAEERIRELNVDLERRVQERTAQLENANKELESFAHTVSHDLRAPLRAVDGFSQALTEEYESRLDDTARDYLHRIRGGARRMGLLIEDLLRLSRLTRTEMHVDRIDLSSLARGIVADLREVHPDRNVDFVVEDNITASADSALIRIALENLLGNAWKFTGNSSSPRIEFGALSDNGTVAYFVRDNGAGFDMAHKEKLFGVFQRLHNNDEFPGTGIGLATVQRIVHRHGGRVWAEGTPGIGAVFYFTLAEEASLLK